MHRIARWCLHWFYRALFALSRHRTSDGVTFSLFMRSVADFNIAFDKFAMALALLREHSPRSLRAVQAHTPRVFGIGIAAMGQYLPLSDLCLVDDELLLGSALTPSRLACTLVHEATHARLNHAGIPYRSENKIRVERMCTRAEIQAAKTFADWSDLQVELERRMASAEDLWSTSQHQAAVSTKLRELGFPEWAIRLMSRDSRRGPANEEL